MVFTCISASGSHKSCDSKYYNLCFSRQLTFSDCLKCSNWSTNTIFFLIWSFMYKLNGYFWTSNIPKRVYPLHCIDGTGNYCKWAQSVFEKWSKIRLGDGCKTLYIYLLKIIELYTNNGCILWHVNYIQIKLLKQPPHTITTYLWSSPWESRFTVNNKKSSTLAASIPYPAPHSQNKY